MLDKYSDKLGDSSCNDWDWPKYFSESDKTQLMNYVPDKDTLEPEWLENPSDFMIVDALKCWVLKELN